MKQILLIIFTQLFFFVGYSQSNDKDVNDVNKYIEYANNLIWHYNYNVRSIRNYQEELDTWFSSASRKKIDMPEFTFVSYSGDKISFAKNFNSPNNTFNYLFHLYKLEEQIEVLNNLCIQVENVSFDNNKKNQEKFLEETYKLINNINTKSTTVSNIAYDFSRACRISVNQNVHPKELNKIRETVAQAKNLILAFRNDNQNQISSTYTSLNKALNTLKNTTKVPEIHSSSEISFPLADLYQVIIDVYNKAQSISLLSEGYMNLDKKKEKNLLLQKIIGEFNEAEGKMGCASSFNTIIAYSKTKYLYFVEEPNTIVAKKIEIVKKKPPLQAIKEKNKYSLDGALPNNIIILLDVSASMKRSEKLPILKKSIDHFLNIMRKDDIISLITYSGEAKVIVSGASKKDKSAIVDSLRSVTSSGGADLDKALKLAYDIGQENFISKGNNKIIIASDGVFGIGYSLLKKVKEKSEEKFNLSVFQYSKKNEEVNIKSLKLLANAGNGAYRIIYTDAQAIDAMMKEIKLIDKSIQ